MDIKDALGLGKILPIDKLIEIVSKSVGRLSKSYFDRKDIDTKSYEIKKLAEAHAEEMKIISGAVNENSHLTGGIEYKEEKLSICSPKEIESTNNDLSLHERTQQRLFFQEAKKQLNIESITAYAADELRNEQEPVSEESIDEDWTSRFFRIAEDISNEEMQTLWGKILAGEVRQPRSFSLKTLELIRNLSKEEADLFMKIANLAISSNNQSFIYNSNEVNSKLNLEYKEIAKLIEIGILQPGDLVAWTIESHETQCVFTSGHIAIIVNVNSDYPDINVPIRLFTQSGEELLKLISFQPVIEYLNAFALSYNIKNYTEVKYGEILGRNGTDIICKVPLNALPIIL